MRILLLVILVQLNLSCSKKIDLNYVEKNGEQIQSTFDKVVISRRNDYILIEDKLFTPSRFVEISIKSNNRCTVNTSNLNEKEKERYLAMIKLLIFLGFKASTSENSIFGIDIKLYGENENLIYCSDITEVKEKEWLNYLSSLHKIRDKWYVESL